MRFVPPKSPEQLAIQALHRIRQRLVRSRTKLVNQIRGILAEHGIVIARDIWRLRRALAEITGHATDDLNRLVRVLIAGPGADYGGPSRIDGARSPDRIL